MERAIDFMRIIFYLIMAIVFYLGVNQILEVTEPWAGQGLIESIKTRLSLVHPVGSDDEAELIDEYLVMKESPLAGEGEYFVRYGRDYNIPPRLMVAMSGAESNFGKVGYAVGTYNAVGLGIHEGRRYVSWKEGIEDMAYVLRNFYFDEGRDNPWEIQNKWAPRCVDGNSCHNSWADNVNYFLEEMNSLG